MRLKTELLLKQARVTGIIISPTAEDPVVSIGLRASLTEEVATAFGCHDIVFAGSVPRSGVDKIGLEGEEIDCQVHFAHDNLSFSATADSVGKYGAKFEGDGVKLIFRVKLKGYADTIADLANKVRVDPLDITLNPAQIPMELHEEKVPQEKVDGGCVDCNNDIPFAAFMDPDGTTGSDLSLHVSGQPCANYRPPTEEPAAVEPAAAPLASAREAVGGTHQKGRKKNQPAPVVEPEFDADEVIN